MVITMDNALNILNERRNQELAPSTSSIQWSYYYCSTYLEAVSIARVYYEHNTLGPMN